MRIVLVSDHATVSGGASAVALATADALRNRGHEVTVWTPKEPQTARTNLWNSADAKRLAGLLNRDTLVHVHSWAQYSSSSIFQAISDSGARHLVTLHDYALACPNGVFFNHRTETICHKTPLSFGCLTTNCDKRSYAQKLYRIGRHVVQRHQVARYVRDVLVVSAYSHARVQPCLPASARVHHVPNPVLIDHCPPANPAQQEGVVMVGAITKGKGALLLAQATASLKIPVVFVGDGSEAEAVLRINPQARITGWVDRDKVQAYIHQARALVFPSLWEETEGLSVLEAQACGVPVIVSANSAARHSIVDGVTGLAVQTGSLGSLTKALSLVQVSDAIVTRMGREAHRRYWQAPRTLTQHVERIENVYREVLQCS